MKAPRSAAVFVERAADACYAAGDDPRAFALYDEAGYLYRCARDDEGAIRCAEAMAMLRDLKRKAAG